MLETIQVSFALRYIQNELISAINFKLAYLTFQCCYNTKICNVYSNNKNDALMAHRNFTLITYIRQVAKLSKSYLSQLLVRAGDEDRVEYGLVSAPLALAGRSQSFGVGPRSPLVDALVFVPVGHAERHAKPLEMTRGVTLQVGLQALAVN